MRILVAAQVTEDFACALAAKHELAWWNGSEPEVDFELADRAEIIIIRSPYRITRKIATQARDLKCVIRAGAGINDLHTPELEQRGIEVYTTPFAHISVAEHAFALLLAAARGIPHMNACIKQGQWAKHEARGTELHGKTMLVVGFGRIGRQVARIACGFGIRLLINDRSPGKHAKLDMLTRLPNARLCDLHKGLANADIIMLCCALNEESRQILDRHAFEIIKPEALLVNIARAELIDKNALQWAMDTGRLRAVGLDVHYNEPSPDTNLLSHREIAASPHIGAQTREARRRIEREILARIESMRVDQ